MHDPAPFAFARDGSLIVCGDGPELLVYEGATGAPLWKAFCDGLLVGVVAAGNQVVTLDVDGRLTFRRALDGREEHELQIEGSPIDLIASPEGRLAVLTDGGVQLVDRATPTKAIRLPGATAASFGPDGNSLGLGSAQGRFVAIDAQSGAAWGQVELGEGPVRGVAWSALGRWVVSSGTRWQTVAGDGTSLIQLLGAVGEPVGRVAVANDGVVAAAAVGARVIATELHEGRSAGALIFRRQVGAVGMGPGALLGVGLDDGDAVRVDLFTGANLRTEPHAGRGRNAIGLELKVDGATLRGASARSVVGEGPIAQYTGPKEEEGGGGWAKTCLGLAGGCLVLLLGLALLSGLTWLALWLRGMA